MFKRFSLRIRQPAYKHKAGKRHHEIQCNDVKAFFFCPFTWHERLRAGNSSSLLLSGKGVKEKRGKNGLLALFPPLRSWPPGLLCSLAPLCGSFPSVQPGAFPQSSPSFYHCNSTGSLFHYCRFQSSHQRGSCFSLNCLHSESVTHAKGPRRKYPLFTMIFTLLANTAKDRTHIISGVNVHLMAGSDSSPALLAF